MITPLKANTKFPYTSNASLKIRSMAASLFDDGINALAIKIPPRRTPKLSVQEKALLKCFVINNSVTTEGAV